MTKRQIAQEFRRAITAGEYERCRQLIETAEAIRATRRKRSRRQFAAA